MNSQLPLFPPLPFQHTPYIYDVASLVEAVKKPKLRIRVDSVEEAAYMNRQRPLFSFLPFEYFSDRSILNPVVISFRTADHE